MHWLASHWQQVAAVLACLVLYWLSVYVSRTPTLRASGLMTLLGDVLLALIAPVPGVGPVFARVLVALRLATAPDRGTREMDVDPAPARPSPALTHVAVLLLAAGLALPACAPGWRERLADRADHVATVAGATVDCYAPELVPLVPRAIVAVVLTVLDPAGAALRFGDLLDQARSAVASPAALACAIAALRDESGGERTAGQGGIRIAAGTGIRGEQAERLVEFAWWAGARDDLPRVAPPPSGARP